MSRKPFDIVDEFLEDLPIIAAIKAKHYEEDDNEIIWDIEELRILQEEDILYSEIKKFINGKRASLPQTLNVPLNQFEVQSDVLYFKNVSAYGKDRFQCCIPANYVKRALMLAHSAPLGGHSGEQHTVHRLKKFAFWPSMRRDAIAFVRNCDFCRKYKKDRVPKIPVLRSPHVVRPWQRVHADLVGPLPLTDAGNRYILTLTDALTRYGIAVAIPNKQADTVARAIFEKVFCVYGVIEQLVTDNGGEFTGQAIDLALKYMKVKHHKVTAYRPSANGLVERFNKQLMEILRSQVQESERHWDRSLCLATFSYNCGWNRSIMESPWFLLYGRDPYLPYYSIFKAPSPWYNIDSYKHELATTMHSIFNKAQQFIEQGQLQQETYRNKKAQKRKIQMGDRVYILKKAGISKLKNKYSGPWRIIDIKGVIVWVRNIANNEKIRVHAERVKLEHQISISDCKNVRACYPVKVDENDWLETEIQESEEISDVENMNNKEKICIETEPEALMNRILPITYEPSEVDKYNYSTRSKGNVLNENWIMKKPL